MNDEEAGRASPSGSNVTMIEVEPRRDPTVEEIQPDYQLSPKSYNPEKYDVTFIASNRQVSYDNKKPVTFGGDKARMTPAVTQAIGGIRSTTADTTQGQPGRTAQSTQSGDIQFRDSSSQPESARFGDRPNLSSQSRNNDRRPYLAGVNIKPTSNKMITTYLRLQLRSAFNNLHIP